MAKPMVVGVDGTVDSLAALNWAAELGEEMERADLARNLFFTGPVGRWMLPAARLHRGVRRVLSDLLACRQPYGTLENRLLREALRP